jgi:hypothetical protein
MKKSNVFAGISVAPGLAAALLYWFDDSFPWPIYAGTAIGAAWGAYCTFLETAANRKIVDRT